MDQLSLKNNRKIEMSQGTISDLQGSFLDRLWHESTLNLNIDFPLNPKILWKTSILLLVSLWVMQLDRSVLSYYHQSQENSVEAWSGF